MGQTKKQVGSSKSVESKKKRKQSPKARLKFPLTGEGTIHFATQMHAMLNEALTASDEFELEISQIAKLDLSFIQLLLALGKSSQNGQKKIFLSAPPADHQIYKVTKLSGFETEKKRKWFGLTVTKNRKAQNEQEDSNC